MRSTNVTCVILKKRQLNYQPQIDGRSAYNVDIKGTIKGPFLRKDNISNNHPQNEVLVIHIEEVQESERTQF